MKQVIRYRSGYKYQLATEYSVQTSVYPLEAILTEFITLNKHGFLFIAKDYAWDGASGPTIDTKSSMRGSLVHDALYQLIRLGVLGSEWRYAADKELLKICIEDGMWKWRARGWFKAVRRVAGFAASPENRKKVHVAPQRRNSDR